ncbi:MAG: hypothetical protein WCS73_10280 [Lentisphaeria bacterium]
MKNTHRYALLLFICLIITPILIGLAIALYPHSYSAPKQFLSALGYTATKEGLNNMVSCLLFNFSLILFGAIIGSYFCVRAYYSNRKILKYLLMISGFIGGIGLIGIGLFPYNLAPDIHYAFTIISSIGVGLAVFFCPGSGGKIHFTFSEDLLWLCFGIFTITIWFALESLRGNMLPITPTAQIQQKLIIAYFGIYMFWNSIILFIRTKKQAIK